MKKLILPVFAFLMLLACSNSAEDPIEPIVSSSSSIDDVSSSSLYEPYGTPKHVLDFTFDDIQYWVGTGSNRAVLIIQLNDGKEPAALAWGYRWDTTETKHGIDMINDIAEADPRFYVLLYNTNGVDFNGNLLGVAVGGFGFDANSNVKLNRSGSCTDQEFGANGCIGPFEVGSCQAPVGGKIITDVYDFDYWRLCPGSSTGARWQSGWFETYISYWVTDDGPGEPVGNEWKYSNWGASSRILKNRSIDAWYWDYYAFRDMEISTYYNCMLMGEDCDGRDYFKNDITPVLPP